MKAPENMAGAQCELSAPEKHANLMGSYHQVVEILNRLDSLNERLGVYGEQVRGGNEKVDSCPDPENLIEVIDRMPAMISDKTQHIHDLISQLESRLI